jgi:hypothetical protein
MKYLFLYFCNHEIVGMLPPQLIIANENNPKILSLINTIQLVVALTKSFDDYQ